MSVFDVLPSSLCLFLSVPRYLCGLPVVRATQTSEPRRRHGYRRHFYPTVQTLGGYKVIRGGDADRPDSQTQKSPKLHIPVLGNSSKTEA